MLLAIIPRTSITNTTYKTLSLYLTGELQCTYNMLQYIMYYICMSIGDPQTKPLDHTCHSVVISASDQLAKPERWIDQSCADVKIHESAKSHQTWTKIVRESHSILGINCYGTWNWEYTSLSWKSLLMFVLSIESWLGTYIEDGSPARKQRMPQTFEWSVFTEILTIHQLKTP